MRRFLLTAIPLIASLAQVPAHAADCGNVTAEGVCQDAKTLVFCEAGELEVIRCQVGELCAHDVDRFNGAAGCIATRYAGCGAVPEQGLCAGSTLLYCANGRVEEFECPSGMRCESVVTPEGTADSDCVVASAIAEDNEGTAREEVPVQPGDDSDDVDNPTPVATNDGAPLPSVQKGGAGPAENYSAGGGGCHSGTGSVFALGLAGLLLAVRRMFATR